MPAERISEKKSTRTRFDELQIALGTDCQYRKHFEVLGWVPPSLRALPILWKQTLDFSDVPSASKIAPPTCRGRCFGQSWRFRNLEAAGEPQSSFEGENTPRTIEHVSMQRSTLSWSYWNHDGRQGEIFIFMGNSPGFLTICDTVPDQILAWG